MQKSSTEVTVGIPFYNDERYLAATVRSVITQHATGWNLILVDDGSNDGSSEIARDLAQEDERISVVARPNGGVAAARNTIMDAVPSGTRYVMFLDHDDVLQPQALDVLRSALEARPDHVGAHGIARNIDADGEPYRPGECEAWCRVRENVLDGRVVPATSHEPTTFRHFAFGQCVATTGACLLRYEAITAAGPWDVEIKGADDYDMYLRLTNIGPFAFVDQVVIDYRWHGENTSGDFRLMQRGYLESKRKALRSRSTTPENRAILEESYRMTARRWARQDLEHARASLRRREFGTALRACARCVRDAGRSLVGLR